MPQPERLPHPHPRHGQHLHQDPQESETDPVSMVRQRQRFAIAEKVSRGTDTVVWSTSSTMSSSGAT